MAFPKTSLFKPTLMLCIVCAHLGLLYLLYYYSPSKYIPASYEREHAPEQITQITFITRPKPKLHQVQKPILLPTYAPQKDVAIASTGLQAEFRESTPPESHANENISGDLKPLDLNLPEVAMDFNPTERDLMARARNPIDYQATRFNNSWKPSGNAVDSLKWKSKTFNFITGILGGNQRVCTDQDRKNRLPECVPDAYQPEY